MSKEEINTAEESTIEKEFTEIFETPMQDKLVAFWFSVIMSDKETFNLTILAPNATAAGIATKQQFPDAVVKYRGSSVRIMQVNDNVVVVV